MVLDKQLQKLAASAPGMLSLFSRVAEGEACIWRVMWSILPPAEWSEEVFAAGGLQSPASVNGVPNSFDSKTAALRASWYSMEAVYGKGGFSEKRGGFGFPSGPRTIKRVQPDGSIVREQAEVFQGIFPIFASRPEGQEMPEAVRPASKSVAAAAPVVPSPEEAISQAIAEAAKVGNFAAIPALVAALQSLRAGNASEKAAQESGASEAAEAPEAPVEAGTEPVEGNPVGEIGSNLSPEELAQSNAAADAEVNAPVEIKRSGKGRKSAE